MSEIESDNQVKELISKILDKYDTSEEMKSSDVYFKDENKKFVGNDIVSMESHNESYTNILKAYSDSLKANLKFKNCCKNLFFYLCIAVMGIICIALVSILFIITYMTFKYQHLSFQISNIIAIVTAIGGAFISSFIIIPKIITEYLFNLKEEENMMNIIQNIQKHDLEIRKDIKDRLK